MNVKRTAYNIKGYQAASDKRRRVAYKLLKVLAVVALVLGVLIVGALDSEVAGVMHING